MKQATIDNDIYNQIPKGWWQADSFLNVLETGIHPIRSDFINACLRRFDISDHLIADNALNLLDIGCGGGIITEDMTKKGFKVTGIDISEPSLNIARQHALANNLKIEYILASAEKLPFPDSNFDIVTCCDVLEHIDDLERVIAEVSRILRPGGLFIYDTINKTLQSKISVIEVAQNISFTRFMPKNVHVWHKFIRPKELEKLLGSHHLQGIEQRGMAPSVNSISMLWYIRQLKTGKIDYATFGRKTRFGYSKSKAISYLGCAKKDASTK